MRRAVVVIVCVIAIVFFSPQQVAAQSAGKLGFPATCQQCHSAGVFAAEPLTPAAPPPAQAKAARLPKEEAADLLRSATSVAVVGETGRQMADRVIWNPNGERAKRNVEEVLTKWGGYNIVSHPEDADLVIVVTEFQKNLHVILLANLVCEMKVYRGGRQPTADSPIVWSGDASEGLHQPSRKVAEKFRDFAKGLKGSPPA